MDPNAALSEIREIIESRADQETFNARSINEMLRLIELVAGLDDWLNRGGLLPDDWKPNRNR